MKMPRPSRKAWSGTDASTLVAIWTFTASQDAKIGAAQWNVRATPKGGLGYVPQATYDGGAGRGRRPAADGCAAAAARRRGPAAPHRHSAAAGVRSSRG